MTKPNETNPVDRMFRCFSDRTRLRILHLLQERELCVGDLVEILDVPQPKVSRHLAYLRGAWLLNCREAGPWKFYSLAKARNDFHRKLIECLSVCFRDVPELAKDAAKSKRLRKGGGCCPQ